MVEHLPDMCETLSSIPSITRKERGRRLNPIEILLDGSLQNKGQLVDLWGGGRLQ